MIKHREQRIAVLVDVSNMYYSAKSLFGMRVNFGRVLEAAVAGRRLVRAMAYVIRSDTPEEQAFFEALEKQGFELKVKDLQIFAGGAKKGDWDVGIAMDAIKMAERLDAVVLVTGDGDYLPLVAYLQEAHGCLVEVIAFSESTSLKLREAADSFIDLSAERKHYLMPAKNGGTGFARALPRVIRPNSSDE